MSPPETASDWTHRQAARAVPVARSTVVTPGLVPLGKGG
jgi:hypothetical protein